MAPGCLLVIDACLTKRLATELKGRGRNAVALSELHLRHHLDDDMLRALTEALDEPYVLVTFDDAMPVTHPDALKETATTLAAVDPRWNGTGFEQEGYKREVVHRWAHVMAAQEPGTIRRYSLTSHRLWVPRRGR